MHFWRTKWAGAINAAYHYLISQSGVQKDGIGVVGASCGANMAVYFSRSNPGSVKALVLLAGPMDDNDKPFIERSPSLPVFAASSIEDIDTLKAMQGIATVQDLVALSRNSRSRFQSFPGAGHATEMFAHEPTLEPAIVDWLRDSLDSKAVTAPK